MTEREKAENFRDFMSRKFTGAVQVDDIFPYVKISAVLQTLYTFRSESILEIDSELKVLRGSTHSPLTSCEMGPIPFLTPANIACFII